MAKYTSRSQRRSRLDRIENKKFTRQATVIFVLTIGLVVALIFIGIPAFIRLAIFLGEVRDVPQQSQAESIPPPAPQLSTPPRATNSATLSLQGFSQAGNTVLLHRNNVKKGETTANEDGVFQFSRVELDEGDNHFYLIAKRASGKESARSATQTVRLMTKPPEIEIKSPEDGAQFFGSGEQTITISGSVSGGADVMVNERMVVTDREGKFSTNYFLEDGDNELFFVATDPAGNTSEVKVKVRYSR